MKTKCDSCKKSVTKIRGNKKHVLLPGTFTIEIGVREFEVLTLSGVSYQGEPLTRRNVKRFCASCGPVVVDFIEEKCR